MSDTCLHLFHYLGNARKRRKLSVPVEVRKWRISRSHTQAFQATRRRGASQSPKVSVLTIFDDFELMSNSKLKNNFDLTPF